MSAERLLVIGPSNIGDAILMSDVVAALHRRYPNAHLTLAVGARARALFEGDPRIGTLVDLSAFRFPAGQWRLLRALWRYRPTVIVDVRHTLYPLLLTPWRAWRYLGRAPRGVRHMRDRQRWALWRQAPGARAALDGRCPLWFSAKDEAQLEQMRQRWKLEARKPLVIMCPGARSHIKRWTASGFARVADRLIGEAGAEVVFSGEVAEEEVVQEILGLMEQRAHSCTGLATIRQAGLLMRQATLVITNDSASLHLASALGVPTVALFGPTDAAKYGPTAPAHQVIRHALFCAPCEASLCRFNHECMRFITPDEVYDAAQELLEQGPEDDIRGAAGQP